MQPDNEHMDDLEYLAKLGFEKVPVSDADLSDLIKKTQARSFSYNGGIYFAFISLVTGVFIGLSLFFIMDIDTVASTQPVKTQTINNAVATIEKKEDARIILDTITIVKENFIASHVKEVKKINGNVEVTTPLQADSVISIPEKPIDPSLLNREPTAEAHLKFIANAPVIYIHDLKVTNYTLLYFRNNRFVKFNARSGTTSEYAYWQRAGQGHSIKESADYFLHEELAEALLYFKKRDYDACIRLLNTIADYNDNDINCSFYLAMCYYYKHQYAKAIALYDGCINHLNNTFLQEAMYYKALALNDSGSKAEAALLFKTIADEEGFYAEKAKGYL